MNRQIQAGEGQGLGHSSIEDAKACLDLVKLKIIEGKLFGVNVGEVSIFQRLSENPNYNAGGEVNLLVTQMVTIHLSRYWYHMVKLESMISTQMI